MAALLGALSASLCAMAAKLSGPRAKDPEVAAALADAAERAEELRLGQLALIDADAEAFIPLYLAYSLPKDAPGRAETLRRLSMHASETPLAMLRLCGDVTLLLEMLLDSAGKLLISDVGCAAAVCRAAADCAEMNVLVNTGPYRDDPLARAIEEEAKTLHGDLASRAGAVAKAVRERLVS